MIKLISANKPFFILALFFWLLCIFLLLSYSKADLHLLLNSYHTLSMDVFFKHFTELGGWFPFLVVGLLLFYRFGAALIVLLPQMLIALPLYAIKQFYDAPRPIAYFVQEQFQAFQVAGLNYHCTNSFPSGHTTAAFALFFSLTVLVKQPWLKVLFVLLAVGVAYSRVYLSQHFAGDVFGGSLIGLLFCLLYIFFQQKYAKPWMDKSLISVFTK